MFESAERRALRDSVRKFISGSGAPNLPEWEEKGEIPREAHRKAGAAGLLGIGFAEEVGGSGGNLLDNIVLWEETLASGGSTGVTSSLYTHFISVPHIAAAGDPDQIQRYVRPTLAGDLIGSLGVTEPGGGSDVAALRTTAVRDGDHYVINGSKTFITSGCRADFITTAVRTGGPGHNGISLIIIDKETPGLTVSRKLDKMGWRCSDTAELAYEDVRVPVTNLVGEEGRGFLQLMQQFQKERIMLTAVAYATAERCLQLTLEWAKIRTTFGEPLIANQVISHDLVAIKTQIELARTYTRECAFRMEAGEDVVAEVCMAKNAAIAACDYAVARAVQYHGGMGFMRESEVERHYRDSTVLGIGGGANEVMTEVAAKRLGYTV